jgi:hypothetical protein
VRTLQPNHDVIAPDIEAVISKRRPDMLQALASGIFMARLIHCRGNVPAALAALACQKPR